MSLKGIFSDSNLSEECYTFSLPDITDKIPSSMIISILSQHSLSGVVVGKKFILNSDIYRKGKFAKGLFIPKGLTYKQVLFRDNLHYTKWTFISLIIVLLIETILLFVLQKCSIQTSIMIVVATCLISVLFIILWQQYIYAKGNAFNNGLVNQNIQINMASFSVEKSIDKNKENNALEETSYEEIK